jgi:4-amino-4-deoxy-L-arabinose transferase-like glycosyltransferase
MVGEWFNRYLNILTLMLFVSIFCFVVFVSNYVTPVPILVILFSIFIFFIIIFFVKKGIDWGYQRYGAKKILLLFLLFSLALRMGWVLFFNSEQVSDFNTMHQSAIAFSKGDYSSFSLNAYLYIFPHMTLYVVTLGTLYKLFGVTTFGIKLLNVFCSVASVLIGYKIAKELFSEKSGLMAAFLFSIYPAPIFYTSMFLTENLAIPFLYGSILLIIIALKKNKGIKYWIWSGLLLGVGHLFRGVGPIFAFAIFLYLIFCVKSGWKEKAKNFTAVIFSMMAVIALLNAVLLATGIMVKPTWKSAMPTSSMFVIGSNLNTNGMWNKEDATLLIRLNYDYEKIDAEAKRLIKERLSDPKAVLFLIQNKFSILWGGGDFSALWWASQKVTTETQFSIWIKTHFLDFIPWIQGLYGLIIIGVILSLRMKLEGQEKQMISILWLLFIGITILHSLIEVQPRYGYVVYPIFLILAGNGLLFKNIKSQ